MVGRAIRLLPTMPGLALILEHASVRSGNGRGYTAYSNPLAKAQRHSYPAAFAASAKEWLMQVIGVVGAGQKWRRHGLRTARALGMREHFC